MIACALYIYHTTDIIYLWIILQTSIPSTISISISGHDQSSLGFILKLTPTDYEQMSFCLITSFTTSPRLRLSQAVHPPCWNLLCGGIWGCSAGWVQVWGLSGCRDIHPSPPLQMPSGSVPRSITTGAEASLRAGCKTQTGNSTDCKCQIFS